MPNTSKDNTSIIGLMNQLEEMEAFLSNCEALEFNQRKAWSRVCREAINKFAVILTFIRSFLPNFMKPKEEPK